MRRTRAFTYPARRRHQIGRSDIRKDAMRHAKKPGKRKSESGSIYFENRRNRSDKKFWL